jgi:hypothetical protein
MPRLDRRRPDPPVRFHIHLERSLIIDHHWATQDVRRGNSIADASRYRQKKAGSVAGHLSEIAIGAY